MSSNDAAGGPKDLNFEDLALDQPPWGSECPECDGNLAQGGAQMSTGRGSFVKCSNGHWFELHKGFKLRPIKGPPRPSNS